MIELIHKFVGLNFERQCQDDVDAQLATCTIGDSAGLFELRFDILSQQQTLLRMLIIYCENRSVAKCLLSIIC